MIHPVEDMRQSDTKSMFFVINEASRFSFLANYGSFEGWDTYLHPIPVPYM